MLFSDPDRTRAVADCPGQGQQRDVPAGTTLRVNGASLDPLDGTWADAARRLRETLPEVQDYRPTVGFPWGAELTGPDPGAHLSQGVTFTWNSTSSPVSEYWIEVYDPTAASPIVNQATSNTWAPVQLPASGAIETLVVRLWTNVADFNQPDQWVWNEYRYNTGGEVTSCDTDELAIGFAQFDGASCRSVCSSTPTSVGCDLNLGGYGSTRKLNAHSQLIGNTRPGIYTSVYYGLASGGLPFCCFHHDPDADVDDILIEGTGGVDHISLSGVDGQLGFYGSALDVEVRGYGGNDVLVGSNETTFGYSEYLRGYNGNDILIGLDGNDRLGGGYEADQLISGGGLDVLYSGQDSVVDVLTGGHDINLLCSNHPRDRLVGATPQDSSVLAQLYFSPVSGTMNADTEANTSQSNCGHTSHGTGWGDCGTYNISSLPADCQAMGLTQ